MKKFTMRRFPDFSRNVETYFLLPPKGKPKIKLRSATQRAAKYDACALGFRKRKLGPPTRLGNK